MLPLKSHPQSLLLRVLFTDYDSVYTLGKKKQKIIDNDMDWTRGGVVKLKGEGYTK